MADANNVDVATVEPTVLKSTDTGSAANLVKAEKKPEPKVEAIPEAAKPDPKPPEGVTDAPDADSPQAGKEKRLPRWMKERLERERQVTEARTRAAVLEEIQKRQPAPVEAVAKAPPEKTLEDFDFDQGKYVDYKVSRLLEQKEESARAEAEQKKQAEASETFKGRIDAFEKRAGDGAWEDILTSPLNTKAEFKPLTDLFLGDEHDLDIAHHLATHFEEAERLLALPKIQQMREIAKLAEQFDGSTDEVTTPSTTPIVKKTTTAPPPVKTVSGAGKPSVDINDPGMTTQQRIAAWRKNKRA